MLQYSKITVCIVFRIFFKQFDFFHSDDEDDENEAGDAGKSGADKMETS